VSCAAGIRALGGGRDSNRDALVRVAAPTRPYEQTATAEATTTTCHVVEQNAKPSVAIASRMSSSR
jgi:hypothetical protein